MNVVNKFRYNEIKNTIQLPYSKSISNRVLIIRALSYDWFKIENLSDSNDTYILDGILKSNSANFNVEDAGTAMRFLTAFLSKIVGEWTLTGTERMKQRPIAPLVTALNELGANINYLEKDGFPPLKILGSNLLGSKVEIEGGISSQFITALLLIAPTLLNGLKINIKGKLLSMPYVHMTLKLMEYFGVHSVFKDNLILVEHQNYEPKNIRIEPDWSAASYWYEIAAFNEQVDLKLPGFQKNSLQGDSALSRIFENFGIKTQFNEKGIRLTKCPVENDFLELNLNDHPDLAPALIVTSAFKKKPFRFTGLGNLKIKESNRIEALKNELAKFGIGLKEPENGTVEITSFPAALKGENIKIETYKDHRIAMAFAPVALIHENLTIKDPGVVKKSYPGFWEDLKKAGFEIA